MMAPHAKGSFDPVLWRTTERPAEVNEAHRGRGAPRIENGCCRVRPYGNSSTYWPEAQLRVDERRQCRDAAVAAPDLAVLAAEILHSQPSGTSTSTHAKLARVGVVRVASLVDAERVEMRAGGGTIGARVSIDVDVECVVGRRVKEPGRVDRYDHADTAEREIDDAVGAV